MKLDKKSKVKNAEYKGFDLQVSKEQSLGGWENFYYHAIRKSDSWVLFDSFDEGEETLKGVMDDLKLMVDDFLENPKDYRKEEI